MGTGPGARTGEGKPGTTMGTAMGSTMGRAARAAVLGLGVAALAVAALTVGGCEWFEAQPETNLPPETALVSCAPAAGVLAGGAVTLRWTGSDIDGQVEGYQWSYDQLGWADIAADSLVIEAVTVGDHTFRVRAIDNRQEADPDPAVCTFAAVIGSANGL